MICQERGPVPSDQNPWLDYIDDTIVWNPLKEVLPLPPARILDLGCGDGRITIRLAGHGFRAIGVDLRGGVGPRVIARGESLPFKAASFDLVILILVLMHVRSAEQLMREVRRVMKTGSRVLVAVGNRQSFTGLAIRENSPQFLLKRIPYDYYRSYSKRELDQLLTSEGFKVEELRSATFVPSLISTARPSAVKTLLAFARSLEKVLERIPFVRWSGIRLFAIAEAVEV
jgi:SAM-dependent methyltransferase